MGKVRRLEGVVRFCGPVEDVTAIAMKLKLEPCPYCHLIGCLILHDWLKGYTEASAMRQRKGKRVFCSDRNRRRGCGRTFVVLLSGYIRRIRAGVRTIWNYLSNVAEGMDKRNAFRLASLHFSDSTIYRIWVRFKRRQSYLRSLLFRKAPSPTQSSSADPCVETIRHLQAAFPDVPNAVKAFQTHFQASFL